MVGLTVKREVGRNDVVGEKLKWWSRRHYLRYFRTTESQTINIHIANTMFSLNLVYFHNNHHISRGMNIKVQSSGRT